MALLRPLLLDNVASIQQSAAMALGRLVSPLRLGAQKLSLQPPPLLLLSEGDRQAAAAAARGWAGADAARGSQANFSDDLAEAVVQNEILPQLVYSLAEQNRFYKKAAAFVLRAVAKHSPPLAQAVVDSGALDALVACLEDFDPGVKEAAAWALGYIAGHTSELAQTVVNAGAIGLLVLCVQEPELSLKRISASALADIAKHSPEQAQAVVDAGAVAYLAPLIVHPDAKLKRQVCACLSQIAKHSVDLAEVVVEAEIFPKILLCVKDVDLNVRKHAATVIRELAKHTPELAQLIVGNGGVAALVEYVNESSGNSRLPGIMALGYIAAFSETLALSIIASKGIHALHKALVSEPEDHLKSASAWSLGQTGRHTPEHAKALADIGVLPRLMELQVAEYSSEDLKVKCKRALKAIVAKLTHLPALDTLVQSADSTEHMGVLKVVLQQLAKVIPNDVEGRSKFVTSDGLKKVLALPAEEGSDLKESLDMICSCYPDEIVKYYSPGYSESLLKKLEA